MSVGAASRLGPGGTFLALAGAGCVVAVQAAVLIRFGMLKAIPALLCVDAALAWMACTREFRDKLFLGGSVMTWGLAPFLCSFLALNVVVGVGAARVFPLALTAASFPRMVFLAARIRIVIRGVGWALSKLLRGVVQGSDEEEMCTFVCRRLLASQLSSREKFSQQALAILDRLPEGFGQKLVLDFLQDSLQLRINLVSDELLQRLVPNTPEGRSRFWGFFFSTAPTQPTTMPRANNEKDFRVRKQVVEKMLAVYGQDFFAHCHGVYLEGVQRWAAQELRGTSENLYGILMGMQAETRVEKLPDSDEEEDESLPLVISRHGFSADDLKEVFRRYDGRESNNEWEALQELANRLGFVLPKTFPEDFKKAGGEDRKTMLLEILRNNNNPRWQVFCARLQQVLRIVWKGMALLAFCMQNPSRFARGMVVGWVGAVCRNERLPRSEISSVFQESLMVMGLSSLGSFGSVVSGWFFARGLRALYLSRL